MQRLRKRLEVVQAREQRAGGSTRPKSSAASRRARVERSRQRAEQAKAGVDQVEAEEGTDELEDETADDIATDEVEGFAGISAPLGVFGVLGNHDYRERIHCLECDAEPSSDTVSPFPSFSHRTPT